MLPIGAGATESHSAQKQGDPDPAMSGSHCSPGEQNPPHIGETVSPHGDGTSMHSHRSPTTLDRHCWPDPQRPPQAGAAAPMQVLTGGEQMHPAPMPASIHSSPAGHSPPQTGAWALEQGTIAG
jgi:hypothetical protein